jgi:hypothetical protein
MSLPHLLGTTADTIPAQVPYIKVPAEVRGPSLDGKGLKVGIAWQGNPQHDQDRRRSIPLAQFAPLRDIRDISWYSLQCGAGKQQQYEPPWKGTMEDLSPQLTDFAVTAAVIAQLDLVISVDTATAHLAGALGRKVWVPIHRGNDWRWLHGRSDSPWYPTMRLFRQHPPRQWQPVMSAMAEMLAALAP